MTGSEWRERVIDWFTESVLKWIHACIDMIFCVVVHGYLVDWHEECRRIWVRAGSGLWKIESIIAGECCQKNNRSLIYVKS